LAEKLQPGKISGELSAAGFRFGIVREPFHSFYTERLLCGRPWMRWNEQARPARMLTVVNRSRAFELPLAAKNCGDGEGTMR